mgnify:CR=1 FL=1
MYTSKQGYRITLPPRRVGSSSQKGLWNVDTFIAPDVERKQHAVHCAYIANSREWGFSLIYENAGANPRFTPSVPQISSTAHELSLANIARRIALMNKRRLSCPSRRQPAVCCKRPVSRISPSPPPCRKARNAAAPRGSRCRCIGATHLHTVETRTRPDSSALC